MAGRIGGRRDFMKRGIAVCGAVACSPSAVLAAAKKAPTVNWKAMRGDPVRKDISGRPDLDNILALFPRTSGEPAFDPERIPENMQGVSFMPFLQGKVDRPPRTHAFSQYTPDMKRDNLSRSIIDARYHLIRYFDQGRTVAYPVDVDPQTFANHEQRCKTKGTRPFVQLFDLKQDPYELNDIGSRPAYAAVVHRLSKRLLDWMKQVNDPLLAGPLRTPYYDRAITDLLNVGKPS